MGPPSGINFPKTQALQAKIQKDFVETSSSHTPHFLPFSAVTDHVTDSNVTTVLQEAKGLSDNQKSQFKSHILEQNARRIFVIFVLLMSDDHLPLTFRKRPDGRLFDVLSSLTKDRAEVEVTYMDDNLRILYQNFENQVNVPIFTKKQFQHTISYNQVLPFRGGGGSNTDAASVKGSFGDVSRVEIHQSHLDQHFRSLCLESRKGYFALAKKTIVRGTSADDFFAKEAHNYESLDSGRGSIPGLIVPIGACRSIDGDFILFPWAEGGNLFEFWSKCDDHRHDASKLLWVLRQFANLASTMVMIYKPNCRHGDLKPENILYFPQNGGRFLIADVGLARIHNKQDTTNVRNERGEITSTPAGTFRYVPPEVVITKNGISTQARSRRYDVWSMGCILCELLIWMVYGHNKITDLRFDVSRYCITDTGISRSVIHPTVMRYLSDIEPLLGTKESAQLSLLKLIRDSVLVRIHDRIDVEELQRQLESICEKCAPSVNSSGKYLDIITSSAPQSTVFTIGHLEVPKEVRKKAAGSSVPRRGPDISTDAPLSKNGNLDTTKALDECNYRLSAQNFFSDQNSSTMQDNMEEVVQTDIITSQNQSSMIHNSWTSMSDNDFALEFIQKVSWEKVKPERQPGGNVVLCSRCSLTSSARLFDSQCHLGDLKLRAAVCELCSILCQSLHQAGYYKDRFAQTAIISLQQNEGVIGVEMGSNLLSVYVPPDKAFLTPAVRVGLPRLLDSASFEQTTLIKSWIDLCGSKHSCMVDYDGFGSSEKKFWPRRLLALGDPLHLVDTNEVKGVLPRYVALSHCWGKLSENEKFCTYNSNISAMMKTIPLASLPRTFFDAVFIARGIKAAYIWIDSLCIVQDNADDWATEAAKMGHIFSAAYCTIAATAAKSSLEGFLAPRPQHETVSLETTTGPVYVRHNIDNFHKDVEMGPLNQRGWVLQELALSRRSIFFTSTQMYWMCGETLYTETLSRLQNAKAAFLGDAHFPKSVAKYYRDGRQILVQDLYERYSKLAFTEDRDRPVAILGLEDRLSQAFNTRAAHGMLARYFPRLLLWKSAGSRQMEKIQQPPESRHKPPSWSWLSRSGPIEYLPLKFEKMIWMTEEFDSPFKSSPASSFDGAKNATQWRAQSAIFYAKSRKLHLTLSEFLTSIFQDQNDKYNRYEDLFGVIIGRDKTAPATTWAARLHILVIRQVPGEDFFERVGVASLRSRQIDHEFRWVAIH